ncbi:MAG: leucine-rich repeat protein [Acutalibacteraceae bacterium]
MSKKNIISLLLSVCIVFSATAIPKKAKAADTQNNLINYSEDPVLTTAEDYDYVVVNGKNISIAKYKGNETKIIIPDTIDGLPVTVIQNKAFRDNTYIEYIMLPKNIATVAVNTFNGCDSLSKVEVPSSNAKYASDEDGVLYNKKKDTIIFFPRTYEGSYSIPDYVTTIGEYSFYRCFRLTGINMHNKVKTVKTQAFAYCWSLSEIHLSDNLREIHAEALSHCDSLKYFKIPSTVKLISSDAFLGGIDSDGNKFYYFTEGISCGAETYAYYYLLKQGIPENYILKEHRTITDYETGVKIIDANDVLPLDLDFDIDVVPFEVTDEIKSLIPIRYAEAYGYEITFTDGNGNEYKPTAPFIVDFTNIADGIIPCASKIFDITDGEAFLISGAPNAPFLGAQITDNNKFVIVTNNDFSIKGDVDGDGQITLYDANLILFSATEIMNLSEAQQICANVDNSSDGVTVEDARLVLRMASNIDPIVIM